MTDYNFKTGINDYIIYLPSPTKDKVRFDSGGELYIDASYKPIEHRHPKAKVIAIPSPEKRQTPVKVGDLLYYHHNIVKNKMHIMGGGYYRVPADPNDPLAFAYERDGKVNMLPPFVFVEPIYTNEGKQNGIYYKTGEKGTRKGILRYASEETLQTVGLKIGDVINFRRFRNYYFDVKGEWLFKMNAKDINFVYGEKG